MLLFRAAIPTVVIATHVSEYREVYFQSMILRLLHLQLKGTHRLEFSSPHNYQFIKD